MERLRLRPLLVASIAALAFACQDNSQPTSPVGDASFLIVDARDGGNPGFFWLAPIDKTSPESDPRFDAGGFNPNLQPRVEICALDEKGDMDPTNDECAASQPAGFPIVFTSTTGPGSETVRLVESDEHYIVNWHTNEFTLDPATTYRIGAYAGATTTQVLGFADVDVVDTGKELKNVNTGEYIALKDGRTLPVKFRIENDFNTACVPGSLYCVSAIINLEEGGSLEAPTGDRVDIPAQGTNTNLPGQILLTLQPCINFDDLPIDLPRFGACLEFDADPVLGVPLVDPALISICSNVDLTGILDEFQEDLVTLHRYDGTDVQALPHTVDACHDAVARLGSLSGLMQIARQGLGALKQSALGLIMPKPLYAGGVFMRRRLDIGRGGATPFFSSFQLALPAEMVIQSGDGQSAPPGTQLPDDPTVLVRDADGRPVNGATVRLMVPATGGGGSVAPSIVTTGADGLASAAWTLGPSAGPNLLDVSGVGIADPSHGGPFMPDISLPSDQQQIVTLETGMLQFTATGRVPKILVGVNTIDDGLSIINFDATSATANLIGPLGDPDEFRAATSMASRPDGTIYVWNNSGASGANDGVLLTVDVCTGLGTRVDASTAPQQGEQALALAPNGTLYGLDTQIASIDPATGALTSSVPLSIPMRITGADFDAQGILYGVEVRLEDTNPERLVIVDPATGDVTIIGELSVNLAWTGSIVFDDDGRLLATGRTTAGDNVLFEIDPTTASVTNVRPYLGGTAARGLGFVPTPSCP